MDGFCLQITKYIEVYMGNIHSKFKPWFKLSVVSQQVRNRFIANVLFCLMLHRFIFTEVKGGSGSCSPLLRHCQWAFLTLKPPSCPSVHPVSILYRAKYSSALICVTQSQTSQNKTPDLMFSTKPHQSKNP